MCVYQNITLCTINILQLYLSIKCQYSWKRKIILCRNCIQIKSKKLERVCVWVRVPGWMQNLTKESTCIIVVWQSLTERNEGQKAWTWQLWKMVFWVDSVLFLVRWFLMEYRLAVLKLLYMYSGLEQMNKWMVDAGSQLPYCWERGVIHQQRQRLQWTMWYWIRVGDICRNLG